MGKLHVMFVIQPRKYLGVERFFAVGLWLIAFLFAASESLGYTAATV